LYQLSGTDLTVSIDMLSGRDLEPMAFEHCR